MATKSKKRRERKRRTAAAEKRVRSDQAERVTDTADPSATASTILTDPSDTAQDLTLVRKAVRWGTLTPDKMDVITDRLMGVVQKTKVRVVGKDGEVQYADEPADANAMRAADILIKCVAQQQKDEQFAKRQAVPRQPSQTQINVGVNIGADERREKLSAIASRIGIDFIPEVGPAEAADGDSEAAVRVEHQQPETDNT